MDAGLAIIAGAAGFITYKVVSANMKGAGQPGAEQKQPFYTDWFNAGTQPQTGNGTPTTDQTGKDIANTVQAVAKFGTSLLDYFGTSPNYTSTGNGVSTGGPTAHYSNGGQDW